MKWIEVLALLLVTVGAVSWGLWSIAHFDLVATLFGDYSAASRVVYGLVGLAGIYSISLLARSARS